METECGLGTLYLQIVESPCDIAELVRSPPLHGSDLPGSGAFDRHAKLFEGPADEKTDCNESCADQHDQKDRETDHVGYDSIDGGLNQQLFIDDDFNGSEGALHARVFMKNLLENPEIGANGVAVQITGRRNDIIDFVSDHYAAHEG